MTRPSPSQARALLYGVLSTLTVAAVTAASKLAYDTKLDVGRFERDSITKDNKIDNLSGVIYRIDSTTKRIESRIETRQAREAHGR